MNPPPPDIHPKAVAEARAARGWYARRSVWAAQRFIDALDRAVQQIINAPKQWPPYLHGTRAIRLKRFPYLVVFIETKVSVVILAVAHGHRRAGYWKKRMP
jgi:toxin ParE2